MDDAEPERAGLANGFPQAGWKLLRGLNYQTGEQSPELRQLNGTIVRIPGFIVPLEDETDSVTEFLLVPYLGACIHVPPPPPNQMVHVRMAAGERAKLSLWDAVVVEGRLDITTAKSFYGDASYSMIAGRVEPYR